MMSVSAAAAIFEQEKPEFAQREARLKAAMEVLREWFREHPDARDYEGRIGFAVTTQRRLDTNAVKAMLGERLGQFQRSVPVETLSLLQRDL